MSTLSTIYAIAFYVATLVLVVGVARKIMQYARTPAPLKIPTTPAPTTQTGVVLRMFREVVFFESLFKSTKWTWLFGWVFHMALFAPGITIIYVYSCSFVVFFLFSINWIVSSVPHPPYQIFYPNQALF